MATLNLGHVVGQGVPSGGTAGQILKKSSSTNFETAWADASSVPEIGAAIGNEASAYNASSVYTEGALCIYENALYRRNSWGGSTPAAEAWTAAHWTATTLAGELGSEITTRSQADTALQTELGTAEGSIAYIVEGKQCAVTVTAGKYVLVKNSTITGVVDGLYTAAQPIPANEDLTSAYFTAVSGGGLNALNDHIVPQNYVTTGLTYHSSASYVSGGYCLVGKLVLLNIRLSISQEISAGDDIISNLPELNATMPCVLFDTNKSTVMSFRRTSDVTTRNLYFSNTAVSGTLIISGAYLTK